MFDHYKHLRFAWTKSIISSSVELADALAFQHIIQYAMNFKHQPVSIEGDNKQIIDVFNKQSFCDINSKVLKLFNHLKFYTITSSLSLDYVWCHPNLETNTKPSCLTDDCGAIFCLIQLLKLRHPPFLSTSISIPTSSRIHWKPCSYDACSLPIQSSSSTYLILVDARSLLIHCHFSFTFLLVLYR